MTTTYKCPKCDGSGFLRHYASIAAGVCFSCSGKGYKLGKPPVRGIRFVISAVLKETNERISVCTITAKNEAEAIAKAVKQLARGNGYFPESARIMHGAI